MFERLRTVLSETADTADKESENAPIPEHVVREVAPDNTDNAPEPVTIAKIPAGGRGQRLFDDTHYRRTLPEGQNAVRIASFNPPHPVRGSGGAAEVFVGARAVQHLPDILDRMSQLQTEMRRSRRFIARKIANSDNDEELPFRPLGAVVVERRSLRCADKLLHGENQYWCAVCSDVIGWNESENAIGFVQQNLSESAQSEVYVHASCVDELSEEVDRIVEEHPDALLGAAL